MSGTFNTFKSRYFYNYQHLVCDTLILSRDIGTPQQLPHIKGLVCVSSSTTANSTLLTKGALELTTGQRAITRLAKKSIAAFNLREKSVVSCMCTLRGQQLYMFLDLLVTFVMPKWDLQAEKAKSKLKVCNLEKTISLGLTSFLEFPQLEPFFPYLESAKGCNIVLMIDPKSIKSFKSSERRIWGF